MENAIATRAVGLSFNAAAAAALIAKNPAATRFRVAVKDGNVFVRPTDRAKGPHVFADFGTAPAADRPIKVTLSDEQMEKLGVTLEQGAKYGVQADRYGWFFLTQDADAGIEGAKATVTKA